MGKLTGKVVLITGAASGIGRASAIRMAAEGAAVMCADIDSIGARETADTIANDGTNTAAVLELDVTDENAVQAAVFLGWCRVGLVERVCFCFEP